MALALAPSIQFNTVFNAIATDVIRSGQRGMHAVAREVPEVVRRNFDVRGRPDGGIWDRISVPSFGHRKTTPSNLPYAELKRLWQSHFPLIDTGALYKSFAITSQLDTSTGYEAEISSPVPYGLGHEKGTHVTPWSGKPVPARPHLDIPIYEEDTLDEIFHAEVGRE